jgi:hypothetical protein
MPRNPGAVLVSSLFAQASWRCLGRSRNKRRGTKAGLGEQLGLRRKHGQDAIPSARRQCHCSRQTPGGARVPVLQVRGARAEPGPAGVVHQHLDVAGLRGQAIYIRGDCEIGLQEAGPFPVLLDELHRLRTTGVVASVDEDEETLARELECGRPSGCGLAAGFPA